MIEQSLLEYLTANLNGVEVHLEDLPHDDTGRTSDHVQLPAMVVQIQERDPSWTQNGAGLVFDEFELHMYEDAPDKAITLARTVRQLLENYNGAMGSDHVTLARCSNEYAYPEYDSGSYVRVLTLSINYRP